MKTSPLPKTDACEAPISVAVGRKDVSEVKATQVLFRFDDGEGKGDLSWLPLVLTLEWAVAHGPERQPRLPGDRLFQNFLQRLGRAERRSCFRLAGRARNQRD